MEDETTRPPGGPLTEVIRARRMTRSFDPRPLPREVISELVELGSWAPSAGKTQGWHLVVLEGDETSRFWDVTLPPTRRRSFRWQQLLDAPVIALPLADPRAYTERYSQPDKQASGLGQSTEAWPVPYWTVDTSMSVMTILLAAESMGLGALFFGVFRGERELRRALGIPASMQLLGAIALGYKRGDGPSRRGEDTSPGGAGRSANRRRRRPDEIIHLGGWRLT
ncbi:MAG: nitroreductase family protein [Desertimonas sp.]